MTDRDELSRRDFLHTAGVAGAGVAMGSPNAATALARGTPLSRVSRESGFWLAFQDGAITRLRRAADTVSTEYVAPGDRLGDVQLRYRQGSGAWQDLDTGAGDTRRQVRTSANGRRHGMTVSGTAGDAPEVDVDFTIEGTVLRWGITVRNPSSGELEIGDLAVPIPIHLNRERVPLEPRDSIPVCWGNGTWVTSPLQRHALLCGAGSFFFWMRANNIGPWLLLTTDPGTKLEYFENRGGYRAFIHSAAAGAVAAENGCNWRQPNTSLELGPGEQRSYGFTFHWATDYEHIRDIRVAQGHVDVRLVPGMTIPAELSARVALRSAGPIHAVEAEYPGESEVRAVGRSGEYEIHEVRFSRLGENRLTIRFGDDQRTYLEFFVTEPIETMIKKRGAFIAAHQWCDPSMPDDGVFAEYAMDNGEMPSLENPGRIGGWRTYHLTANDGGLGKPSYLGAKQAEYPLQEEVDALDYYVERFLWGNLQRSTEETFSYGIYRSPDKRHAPTPGRVGKQHLWRLSDYAHVALVYWGLYRVARYHPHIRTAMTWQEYLQRAFGTSLATFTIPWEIEGWSAYYTGLKNGIVTELVIDALENEGMEDEVERLRPHWDRKARTMVTERPDLFLTEYPFGCIGFEGSAACARWALRMAEPGPVPERDVRIGWVDYPEPTKIPLEDAREFMELQMIGNIFMRGWLETSYYYYGVAYGPKYMAPMGGWGVLDYALYHAADPFPYLRLGYASFLSTWAQMNSGPPESNYGYWFPGPEHDGGAGGDFEDEPYGETWLGQPHSRGIWFYSGEIDLGFCGALRCARTVLADDPLFGRICYGGDWSEEAGAVAVVPRDGVRRRFHALVDAGRFHLIAESDRFVAEGPIRVRPDLSEICFELETDSPEPHMVRVKLLASAQGTYELRQDGQPTQRFQMLEDLPTTLEVAVAGRRGSGPVTIAHVSA